MNKMRGTTIVAVRHRGKVAVAGDGQVTLDTIALKHGARKVRRLYNDKVIVGFAGATADAFTLFDRFDQKLEQYGGNLLRAAVELTKDWRTDRVLRHLEALMIAVSDVDFLIISGNGDVIESDDEVLAIGSGGPYAQAAARALIRHSKLSAKEIVEFETECKRDCRRGDAHRRRYLYLHEQQCPDRRTGCRRGGHGSEERK